MDQRYVIPDMFKALRERTFPTLTLWNRLEGRPRTTTFDRALKAEVRDALWMLTRQWQMGEFQGDDAGSPIFAKLHIATTGLTKFQADGHPAESFQAHEPLEAKVERRPIPFALGQQVIALDLRLLMGRQWLKLVGKVGNYAQAYIAQYPVPLPDPASKHDAGWCAHPEVWQLFAAASGRAMDGALLYAYLQEDPARHAYDGIPVIDAHKSGIDDMATRFMRWFEQLFTQPSATAGDSWQPDRLEYQFACAAPEGAGEKVLVADEYYHGRLDWYNLEIDRASPGLGETMDGAAPDPSARKRKPCSQRPWSLRGCPTPAGGPLRIVGRILATSNPTPPSLPNSCSWSLAWSTPTIGS